jgi:hypothetical protein
MKTKPQKAFLICCLCVAIFLWERQAAAGMDIYGDFSTIMQYSGENKEYLGQAQKGDLGAYLDGNLYFSQIDADFYQYMLALGFEGNLADRNAPVAFTVKQLFLQLPLSDYAYLYCGKKSKETGASWFFNVSNRISPKFLSGFDYERTAPGFIEASFIHSGKLAYGGLLYFRDAENWDQVNTAVYTDYNHGNFNADLCLYFEELPDPSMHIGSNLSYQYGIYQFYIESIWKEKAEQYVVVGDTGNPLVDFAARDGKSAFATVFGVSLTKEHWGLVLEYLWRQEGYNQKEQRVFIDYLKKHGPVGLIHYSRCALLQNYLAVHWYRKSFIHPSLALGVSSILSFQPGEEEFSQYAAGELTGSISYMLSQNCELALYSRCLTGGMYGEFSNLSPEQSLVALVLTYQF